MIALRVPTWKTELGRTCQLLSNDLFAVVRRRQHTMCHGPFRSQDSGLRPVFSSLVKSKFRGAILNLEQDNNGRRRIMDQDSQGTTNDGERFLDDLYNLTAKNGSAAMQFRVFDVQLCGALSQTWLLGELCYQGITSQESKWMIDEGLLRIRSNFHGEQ